MRSDRECDMLNVQRKVEYQQYRVETMQEKCEYIQSRHITHNYDFLGRAAYFLRPHVLRYIYIA